MSLLLSEFTNGLVLTSYYALVACGLVLIFGVVGIVNFAHGDFVMLGGYLFYEFYIVLGEPYLAALVLATLAEGALALLMYVLVVRRLVSREWYAPLIGTLALSVLLESVAQAIWSAAPRSVATPAVFHVIRLGTAGTVNEQEIYVFVGTALCLLTLWAVLGRSKWGKAMRAVAQNREACAVNGINVSAVALGAFVAAAALCALAAALVLPLQLISPTAGDAITTQAFVVVILGGMGSIRGAVVASFIVGMVTALSAAYMSSAYTDAFGYGVMILMLLFRPVGLFGDASLRGWTGL